MYFTHIGKYNLALKVNIKGATFCIYFRFIVVFKYSMKYTAHTHKSWNKKQHLNRGTQREEHICLLNKVLQKRKSRLASFVPSLHSFGTIIHWIIKVFNLKVEHLEPFFSFYIVFTYWPIILKAGKETNGLSRLNLPTRLYYWWLCDITDVVVKILCMWFFSENNGCTWNHYSKQKACESSPAA